MFWLSGVANSGSSTQVFQECAAINACSNAGSFTDPLASNNRIEVPERALKSPYLFLTASCGSTIMGAECPAGKGDENGNAAVVELFAADLLLTQETSPTVQEVKGPLAEAGTISGTSDIAFTATDSGSGVYEAIFTVDGKPVSSTVLSANGGRCHNVGQTTDGLPAFLYTQPCPASLSVDVPLNTTTLSNGSHHLLVSVTDAAGNSTPVVDRQVTIANSGSEGNEGGQSSGQNPGSSPGGNGTSGNAGGTNTPGTNTPGTNTPGTNTPGADNPNTNANGTNSMAASALQPPARGPANGSEASDAATLSAHWKGSESARLQSAYGQSHTLEGTLIAPDGRPIADARIEASKQAATSGAHAAALPSAYTNAQGRFSLTLPRSSSSMTLSLAYRSHLGDPLPAATRTLTLAIRAEVVLHIAPRAIVQGRTIHFSGSLLGGSIPPGGKQLVLEGRSPGAPWAEFDVVRTNAHGVFHATHRFRLPGPIAYSFRVLSGYEADYPFLAGSSNVVGVVER
jgi:hypothetical protein